jgi:hypothetical protein
MTDVSVPIGVTSYVQPIYAANTKYTVTASITTVSAAVVPANPSRLGILIYNNSANSVYINFGATASSSNAMCVLIATFTTYQMLGPAIYTGQISGIRNAGSGTLLVTELIS